MKKLVLLLLAIVTPIFLVAQAKKIEMPSLDESDVNVTTVSMPEPKKGEEETLAKIFTITGEGESRIAVKDLGMILRPVALVAVGENNEEFEIKLVKRGWDEKFEEQQLTSENGKIEYGFKTNKGFGIKTFLKEGNTIQLAVFVGKKKIPESDLFVDIKTMKKKETSNTNNDPSEDALPNDTDNGQDSSIANSTSKETSSNTFLYVIIGVLALGIAFLLGKRNSKKTLVLLFCMAGTHAFSQSQVTVSEIDLGALKHKGEIKVLETESKISGFKGASAGFSGAASAFKLGYDLLDNYEKFKELSEDDRGLEIDLDPSGQPSLPSSCLDPSDKAKEAGCKCLEEAYEKLKDTRLVLERNRIIAEDTKAYVDWSISFGDSMSSLPGLGLGWPPARKQIMDSFKKHKEIYARAQEKLFEFLYDALQEISACEEKMGEENWYGRYGFMYYEFIKSHYAEVK